MQPNQFHSRGRRSMLVAACRLGMCLLAIALLAWAGAGPLRAADLTGRVTAGGHPVADAVLFIDGLKEPPVHAQALMDQRNRTFIPHVLVVQLGTRVDFPNHDRVFHNVFSTREGRPFDLGLYPVGKTRQVVMEKPGLQRLFCNIHSNMGAFIWVMENGCFAITDRDGRFRVANVPGGARVLRVWHERLGSRRLCLRVPDAGALAVDVNLDTP